MVERGWRAVRCTLFGKQAESAATMESRIDRQAWEPVSQFVTCHAVSAGGMGEYFHAVVLAANCVPDGGEESCACYTRIPWKEAWYS